MKVEEAVKDFTRRLEKKALSPEKSRYYFTEIIRNYYQRVLEAKEKGEPVAWISLMFPCELLLSMDIMPFVVENYTIQLFAMGKAYDWLQLGLGYGFCTEGCSPHLGTIGGALQDVFPRPDLIMASSQAPCDSASAMVEVLSDLYNVPTYYLNYPYRLDDEVVDFLEKELWDMVVFLEEHTNKRFEPDRLREVLEVARVCQDYYLKTHALRKLVPTPINTRDSFASFGVRIGSEGLPETINFFKAQYEETLKKAEQGVGAVPKERHRYAANGAYPFWNMRLLDWLEKEYGAVAVVDLHNMTNLEPVGDTSNPMKCLARKVIYSNVAVSTAVAPYMHCVNTLVDRAIENKADSAIFFAHFGCKQGCGRSRLIVDQLKKRAGISTLILELDAGNPAVVSDAQMKMQLARYFDMLEGR